MPGAVEDDQVGGIEMLGEPVGLDDPLLGGLEHVSSPFPRLMGFAELIGAAVIPVPPRRHRQKLSSACKALNVAIQPQLGAGLGIIRWAAEAGSWPATAVPARISTAEDPLNKRDW